MSVETANESARSDAKRRAILEVGSEVFLAQGYAATSMSEIAARVGGSKATLYNYFRSKEELFSALMTEVCAGQAASYFDPLPPIGRGQSVRESLIELGVSLLEFLLQEDIVAVHRLVVAEAGRFPEIGRLFYENGPQRGEARFTELFREAMAAGVLPAADPRTAGQRLKDLVLSDVFLRRLWGVLPELDRAALREHVAAAVDVYLAAVGP
jgi:TetR/AcrR family transcriptional regulator, mexJK operon transcriptional repressor